MLKTTTCIVSLVDENNGKIWMGGDAAGVAGYSINKIKYPKVFIKDSKFIIGYTSSFRMGQLLEHVFKPPKIKQSENNYQYLVKTFVPELMNCLSINKFTHEKENVSSGGEFLIGFNHEIFKIQCDFAVITTEMPYFATGCGEDLALGSLFTTYSLNNGTNKIPANKMVEMALQTASTFSAGVSPPFTILSL